MQQFARPLAATLFALALGDASASCGAAFCSVNTSWDAQGGWAAEGTRLDLRYEVVTQDQPMNGSARVAFGQVPRHHDERVTRNRNTVLAIEHSFGPDWSLGATVPLAERRHEHVHNHRGGQIPEAWGFTAAGDARVIARRRVFASEGEGPSVTGAGLSFGAKLPTGRRNERNGDGTLAERPLQPGTGTTDLLVGSNFTYALPTEGWSGFAQGMVQAPLGQRDGFRPGRRVSVDLGVRREIGDRLSAMLQFNALWRGRDGGVQAEPEDTGGRSLFASPGASYAFSREWQGYAFLQLPLHQHVNGVQLVARRAAVFGLSARF